MSSQSLRVLVVEALNRYGDKCLAVLKAALRISKKYESLGAKRPGDFDYRGLIEELERLGVKYNPSMMLRILEREYGIIRTVSHTLTHRWYKFVDRAAVEDAIAEYEGTQVNNDPELMLLRVQIAALDLPRITTILKELLSKKELKYRDLELFKLIAFRDLPLLVKVLKKSQKYSQVLASEIDAMNEVLRLALLVSSRIRSTAIKEEILDTICRESIVGRSSTMISED